ncbi:MAG TPA: glyceraldehyde 3-phosphate dehydrogenase NAD-binding domain-containing protein [Coriobacteriia bacterium]|jgi:glyceraldehyde 3-phosphate dehydrogenase
MPAKCAINGFGRIGRACFKIALDHPDLELVAVNDLADIENMAYLLKHDTVYGTYEKDVRIDGTDFVIDGQRYRYLSEKDPAKLPWRDLGVGIVFECTGLFTKRSDLEKHLQAGARFAILSAPSKGTEMPTVVYGVNQPDGEERIISCASCTTNSIAPVIEILGRRVGVRKATMVTVHAYTASQALVDGPDAKEWRRGRAGAANLVPGSTGAAVATTRAVPEYEGRFGGTAVRAPVDCGSISVVTLLTERATSAEEVNGILGEEAGTERYRDVVGIGTEPLVSSDIVKDSRASIVDAEMTQVVDGDLVTVMAWYDNEWGYTNQMVRAAARIARTSPLLETAGV